MEQSDLTLPLWNICLLGSPASPRLFFLAEKLAASEVAFRPKKEQCQKKYGSVQSIAWPL